MPDTQQIATYARLLRLTPVQEAAPLQPMTMPAGTTTPEPAHRRAPRRIVAFCLLVVLPTCLAIGFFWLLAADRYQSEARFILRTPSHGTPNAATSGAAVAGLAQGAGPSRTNEDSYVVRAFLESRDAAALLERTAGLRQAFAAARWDPVWGFPAFYASDRNERLFHHYERMMSATFDTTTGVSTLKIEAFTAEDARRLAKALLAAAEGLVNRLNDRARHDAISFAESEADRMRQRAVAAQTALTAFRERERMIDPNQATLAVIESIARLSIEAADVAVQLNELGSSSPQAPQIRALRNRWAALEEQITTERHRLAGDARSIAPRIAEYERLMLERDFAEKALMSAMTAVEMARIDAQRQQVYLERVAEPSLPDYPAYPLRIVWTLAIVLASFMAFRIWLALAEDALLRDGT